MKNLMKVEERTINSLKRELTNFEEAQSYLFGYIQCMVDMGYITEDRGTEEIDRTTRRLLERK